MASILSGPQYVYGVSIQVDSDSVIQIVFEHGGFKQICMCLDIHYL